MDEMNSVISNRALRDISECVHGHGDFLSKSLCRPSLLPLSARRFSAQPCANSKSKEWRWNNVFPAGSAALRRRRDVVGMEIGNRRRSPDMSAGRTPT
jgi:hypothetical protein